MTKKFRGHLYQQEDGTYRLDTFEIENTREGSHVTHGRFDGWEVVTELQALHTRVSEALIAKKNSGE